MPEYLVVNSSLSVAVILACAFPLVPVTPFRQEPFLPAEPVRLYEREVPPWAREHKRHHFRKRRPGRR